MLILNNHLQHFYYFYLVAKFSSFTQAAKFLSISQSAVSIQVKALENKLATQLFLREAKNRIVLSQDGHVLYDHCCSIYAEVEAALNHIQSKEIQGELVVTASPHFGAYLLVPYIKVLRRQYPKLNVALRLTDEVFDFQRDKIDLAIRYVSEPDRKLCYRYILDNKHIMVASKNYLKENKTPQRPRDIESHVAIVRHPENVGGGWKNWLAQFPKQERPHLQNLLAIENTTGMVQAVREGLGISVIQAYTVSNDLKSGTLMQILPKYTNTLSEPFYACYPKTPFVSPKIEAYLGGLQKFLLGRYKQNEFVYLKGRSP